MRNRAKCKICKEIIESFHRHDYVTCKCGEISVNGGTDYCKASARDYANFLRVADDGTEIIPKVIEKSEKIPETGGELKVEGTTFDPPDPPDPPGMSANEILEELQTMVQFVDRIPESVLYSQVTQADFYKALMLICAILRRMNGS